MYVCMYGCGDGRRDALCMMFRCRYKIGMAVNYVLSSRVAREVLLKEGEWKNRKKEVASEGV